MAVREYIGARYVPIFVGQWDNTNTYEPLSVVQYQGNSFTSRQYVPIGIEITNEDFWIETGNYNAQVEAYRQEVLTFDGRIDTLENKFPIATSDITDGAITSVKLGNQAVNQINIHDNAISTAKIQNDAITADKLSDDSVITLMKRNTNFLTPEMFGAVGGTTDDSAAFQDMFDACTASARNVCILTKPQYTIREQLYIDCNYISLIGLNASEYTPTLHFDRTGHTTDFYYGIRVRARGIGIDNIDFNWNSQVYDETQTSTYLLYFDPYSQPDFTPTQSDDGYNCDAWISDCTFGKACSHIKIRGRNVNIHDCEFSSWKKDAIYIDDAQIVNMRGYRITDCRFHAGTNATCINTNAVTTYTGIFDLVATGNFIDLVTYFYRGISDGIILSNNFYHQHVGDGEYAIYLYRSVNANSHITTIISNNTFTDIQPSTRLKGMVLFQTIVDGVDKKNIWGNIEISNNTFDTQYSDSAHGVIIIRVGKTLTNVDIKAFVNVLNNIIRIANSGTPIQCASDMSHVFGYIDGNSISTTGETFITEGSLTVGNNFTNTES